MATTLRDLNAQTGRDRRRRSASLLTGAAGLGLASTATVAVGWSSPAAATPPLGGTCNTSGSFFTGYGHSYANIDVNGAYAIVDHHTMVLCTGQASASSAWALVHDNTSPPTTDLAQAGWLKDAQWSTDTVYFFWECEHCWTEGGTPIASGPMEFRAVGAPDNYNYQDSFTVAADIPNDLSLEIYPTSDPDLSGVLAAFASIVDPQTNEPAWTANAAEWSGETHWNETQMPGAVSHKAYFYHVQDLINGSWTTEDPELLTRLGPAPGSTIERVAYGEFRLWDTRTS